MKRAVWLLLWAICVVLTAAPGAASAASDSGNQSSCGPGTVAIPLAGVESLPDGGVIDHYFIDGDTKVPVPPQRFDPLAASAAQLVTYGFPPRPTDASSLEQWQSDLASWQYSPDKGLRLANAHFPAGLPLRARSNGSAPLRADSPWAGYVTHKTVDTYIAVQGNFTQPAHNPTNCSSPEEGSWTGVGGYATLSLIQTGTGMTMSRYYAWYEYLDADHNNPAVEMANVTVRAGDHIHTYVVYQRSTGQTTFYVANNTNGTSQSVIKILSASYWDGTSAEAIDEAPGMGNLIDFDTVAWSNLQVYDLSGTWHTLGSQGPFKVSIYRAETLHTLASPGAMTDEKHFTDFFYYCE
jgi:hypothetical protein